MASTPEIIIAQICVNSPRMRLAGKTNQKNGLKPVSRIRRMASADIGTIEASPQTKSKISAIQVSGENGLHQPSKLLKILTKIKMSS